MAAQLAVIFVTVFLAELGDKTQLATVLFAADRQAHPVLVFMAASLALVASTGIAVAAGTLLSRYTDAIPLKLIAGLGFVIIGLWTIYGHYNNS